jgi:hypothetical protein
MLRNKVTLRGLEESHCGIDLSHQPMPFTMCQKIIKHRLKCFTFDKLGTETLGF